MNRPVPDPVSGHHPVEPPPPGAEAEGPARPGAESAAQLLVIGLGPEPGPWEGVVTALSEALGLEPAREAGPAPPGDPELVERVLERAAAVPGPVLILPPARPAEGEPRTARTLERVLAPFDSEEVSEALRPVLDRLQEAGVQVAQLLVMTADTLPPMWDGVGHHAAAWHAELRRRHQVGEASVEVTAGVPATTVVARAGDADLVVLCWGRPARAGGARTLRAVLAAIDVPLLLVPVA